MTHLRKTAKNGRNSITVPIGQTTCTPGAKLLAISVAVVSARNFCN